MAIIKELSLRMSDNRMFTNLSLIQSFSLFLAKKTNFPEELETSEL